MIEGTRVPYDKVAALLLDDVPAERISDYYPSVTASAAMDAADFADYVDSYDISGKPSKARCGRTPRLSGLDECSDGETWVWIGGWPLGGVDGPSLSEHVRDRR